MESKKIKVMDASGQWVEATVDASRYATWDTFVRNSGLLDGHGAAYGRPTARDATEAHAFLVSQLSYVEPTVYEKEYQPRQYVELLPGSIDYSAGEHVKSVEYEMSERAGKGRRSSSKGTDIPTVDVSYSRKVMPVEYGTIGYQYTQEELRTSAFMKRPIDTTLLRTAIEGFEDHMDDVALRGEAESNLTGLFNNANIPQANRPSGAAWSASTPDLILADFNAGIGAVWANTFYNSVPVKAIVPPAVMPILMAPRSGSSDKTILQWVLENNLAKNRKKPFETARSRSTSSRASGSTPPASATPSGWCSTAPARPTSSSTSRCRCASSRRSRSASSSRCRASTSTAARPSVGRRPPSTTTASRPQAQEL